MGNECQRWREKANILSRGVAAHLASNGLNCNSGLPLIQHFINQHNLQQQKCPFMHIAAVNQNCQSSTLPYRRYPAEFSWHKCYQVIKGLLYFRTLPTVTSSTQSNGHSMKWCCGRKKDRLLWPMAGYGELEARVKKA